MPASDLLWNPSQGQGFQCFGAKRKSSFNGSNLPEHDVDMDLEVSGDCKRRCMGESVRGEVNHNDPELHSYHKSQLQSLQPHPYAPDHSLMSSTQTKQTMVNHAGLAVPEAPKHFVSVQQYYGGPQYLSVETPVQPVDKYPAHTTSETNMVMDLCDETYSYGPDQSRVEMEAAENQMDSDFTPNQQQYKNNTLAFCQPYCVGDEASPGPRVRCYCKPNWDGLMDLRPYVSDYY